MVEITRREIETAKVIRSVRSDVAGAIDIFIGTTRNHSKGLTVTGLEYEAYEPMALKMMNKIVAEAKAGWAIHKVAMVHRIGHVGIGEASVVIAVSSAHRKEAFGACRHLIDRLKEVVPIWKKEFFADGMVEWSRQVHEQSEATEHS